MSIDADHYRFQNWPDTTRPRIGYDAARTFVGIGFPEDDQTMGRANSTHSASMVLWPNRGMQVNDDLFIDYYELMQLSPNADDDTIRRIFRHLAQKWHPDHQDGDPERFKRLLDAQRILSNPETRAAYDVKHQKFWESKWKMAAEASGSQGFMDDKNVRERMLSLYYVERRSKMHDPGLGEMEVSRLLRIPIELIEFHIWYLKEKGWVQRLENGKLAITASGVDQVEKGRLQLSPDRLIAAHGSDQERNEGEANSESDRSLPTHDKKLLDLVSKQSHSGKTCEQPDLAY